MSLNQLATRNMSSAEKECYERSTVFFKSLDDGAIVRAKTELYSGPLHPEDVVAARTAANSEILTGEAFLTACEPFADVPNMPKAIDTAKQEIKAARAIVGQITGSTPKP